MFRSEEFRILELCRALAVEQLSVPVQALIRGHLTRTIVQRIRTVAPELEIATCARDISALNVALAKAEEALGSLGFLAVAIPVHELRRAKAMKAALDAAPVYNTRLRQEAWADLSNNDNYERLLSTLQEPQYISCVAEK